MTPGPEIRRFVDAHVHHWDTADLTNYPHLALDYNLSGRHVKAADVMKRRYTAEDYHADAGRWNLIGYVHVAATSGPRSYLWESRELTALADGGTGPSALVGSVDLTLEADEVEKDLAEQSASRLFRGVRTVRIPDLRAGSFARALSYLQDNDLIYDLVVHPHTMAELTDAISGYPDLHVVVEHTGWPTAVDDDERRLWQEGMRRLAGLRENVACKLSGIAMTTNTFDPSVIGRWLRGAVQIFGVDRCMVGSNFPVDGVDFDELMSSYLEVLRPFGADALDAMFAANAERIYRIDH
jgi:L-fuconolactonase